MAVHNHLFKHQSASINMVRLHPEIPYIFLIGGFGCGKSYTDVQLCLFLYQCYKDSPTAIQIGVFGVTIKLLKQTVIADLERAFDAAGIPYRDNSQAGTLTVGNIIFVYLAMQYPDDIYAFNFTCCLVDEIDELPPEKVKAVVKAVQERNRVKMPANKYFAERSPFVFFSTTAQGMGGTYNLVREFEKHKIPHAIIRGRTQDNTSLDPQQIKLLRALYTEDEAKAYLDGEFVNLTTGRVYYAFNRKTCMCMRFPVKPTDKIYVGQDFNCIAGSALIATRRGLVRMDSMRVGMEVLTRKGYRKVLAVLSKGIQAVEKYNNLIATKDHVAITEEGDLCLKNTKSLLTLPLAGLKRLAEADVQLSSMIEGISQMTQDILSVPIQTVGDFTEKYGSTTMERYLRGMLYIILMRIRQIIGLRTCVSSAEKNIQTFIGLLYSQQMLKSQEISREEIYPRMLGLMASMRSLLLAIDAVSNSGLPVRLPASVKPVSYLIGGSEGKPRGYEGMQSTLIMYLECVKSVAQHLRELLPLCTAVSIQSIGSVHHGEQHMAEVYDLVVEDTHEFFADGVLVHNCGYNASCEVVERAGVMYIVDSHHWEDMGMGLKRLRELYPTNEIILIPDASGKEIMQGFAEEALQYSIGIHWNNKNSSITERIMAVNKLFMLGQLKVMEPLDERSGMRGTELKNSLIDKLLLGLETRDFDDAGKPRKGKGPDALDHGCDSSEYAIWHILHTIQGYDKILECLKGVNYARNAA